MTTEEIKQSLGKTIVTTWGEYCRITKITDTYFVIDSPEKRTYFTNGKLNFMPQKKVYFDTRNQCWNLKTFTNIVDNYEFKMVEFKPCMLAVKKEDIQPNSLPTIEESLKLVQRQERRTKEEIKRAKLLGYK
jgi:hypothetical protein